MTAVLPFLTRRPQTKRELAGGMTVLLGPVPCHACRQPVTVVRRPVILRGHQEGCGRHHGYCVESPSTELREVVTVDRTGDHRCIRA